MPDEQLPTIADIVSAMWRYEKWKVERENSMPVVTKQTATGNSHLRPSPSSGGILSRAIPVKDIAGEWIRILIYGRNRVGKTWLACQFPKPLLLISFEPNPTGGSKTVEKVPGVVLLHLTSSADGLALCSEIQQTGGRIPTHLKVAGTGITGDRFASYVVDGATSYQDIVLQEIMNWDKIPEQLSFGMVGKERYQERAEKTKEGLRPFTKLPGNVVLLAKEKDHNPPKDDWAGATKLRGGLVQESHLAADVGGGVAGWLNDACDCITQLYLEKEVIVERFEATVGKEVVVTENVRETGRIVRRLRTQYHPNYAAGFRSCNPTKVPPFIEDPTYAKIAKVFRGEDL